jgi:catechol 2,3-dioxygenase-like lactoylglutathione lyase family enzyme
MVHEMDDLLTRYERGSIDRRQLLTALLMLPAAAASGEAQGTGGAAFRGRILNHVTLSVSNVTASRAFYIDLIGATVQKEAPNQTDLRIGDSFVTVLDAKQAPSIMHFCVGVENFDGDAALARLKSRFAQTNPRLVTNELGQKQIVLRDPDGLTVEIADPKYRL